MVVFGGVSTAWLVTTCRFPGQRWFEWTLILPLAMPAYIMAYAYTDLLQFTGPVQTWLREAGGWRAHEYWFPEIRSVGGAIVMLGLVLYPYVYLVVRAAFLEQSVGILEVGRTLGYGPWRSFFRIALPLVRPAIVAGTTLALMETLADFGTVSYFAVPTFTTGIYRAWLSMGDRVAAAQLSALLLGFVVLVLLLERWSRGRARYYNAAGRRRDARTQLSGIAAWTATAICSVPLLLGFLLPAGLLLRMAVTDGDAHFGARFVTLTLNSFTLAGVTAIAAVVLALIMAYAMRLRPGPVVQAANRIAGLGYAVPGAVIAIGILVPVARLDNAIDAWMRAHFDVSTGIAADRQHRRAGLCLSRAVSHCRAADGGGGAHQDHSEHGRSGALAGRRPRRHAGQGARAADARQPADRRVAGVRGRDERTAGHVRDAAVQFRHAGRACLQPRHRRAARRSVDVALAIVAVEPGAADRTVAAHRPAQAPPACRTTERLGVAPA